MASQASSEEEGFKTALENAKFSVSSAVLTHIRSRTRVKDRMEASSHGELWSSEYAHALTSITDNLIQGITPKRQHFDEHTGSYYLLVSVDEAIIHPTPSRMKAQFAEIALRKYATGDLRSAADLWEAAYAIEPSMEVGEHLIQCYRRCAEPSKGLRVCEFLLADFPKHERVPGWQADAARFEKRLQARMADYDWDREVGRLVTLFEQRTNRRVFRFNIHEDEAHPFRKKDDPHAPVPMDQKVLTTIRTDRPLWLTLLWLDAEGLFFAPSPETFNLGRGLERFQRWNLNAYLPSGTVTGKVTVMALVTEKRPDLEFEPFLKTKARRSSDRDAIRLTGFIDNLEDLFRKTTPVTAVDRFHVIE